MSKHASAGCRRPPCAAAPALVKRANRALESSSPCAGTAARRFRFLALERIFCTRIIFPKRTRAHGRHGAAADSGLRGRVPAPFASGADAVSHLFREHNRVLVGYLTGRLRSEQEAKEVAQEAYVRLLQQQAELFAELTTNRSESDDPAKQLLDRERANQNVASDAIQAAGSPELAPATIRAGVGQRVTYSKPAHGFSVASVDPKLAGSWRHGILQFVGEPLEDVADEVNRYSARRIVVAPEFQQTRFTGTVSPANVRDWLQALEQIYSVQVLDRGADGVLIRSRAHNDARE